MVSVIEFWENHGVGVEENALNKQKTTLSMVITDFTLMEAERFLRYITI